MSLEDDLNSWIEDVGGLVNFTLEEREQVTKAGSEVLKNRLSKATKDAGHYNPDRDTTKMKHLADSVETGTLQGSKQDGTTTVGFSDKDANHARIAHFLNDGTIKYKGDSFWDDARDNSVDDVTEAELKVLKELQKGKGD